MRRLFFVDVRPLGSRLPTGGNYDPDCVLSTYLTGLSTVAVCLSVPVWTVYVRSVELGRSYDDHLWSTHHFFCSTESSQLGGNIPCRQCGTRGLLPSWAQAHADAHVHGRHWLLGRMINHAVSDRVQIEWCNVHVVALYLVLFFLGLE